MSQFFNLDLLEQFPFETFHKKQPFPWFDLEAFLTPQAFQLLHEEFPSLDLFEYHENIYRSGQRPHNRYYLAYESSLYHPTTQGGIVHKMDLKPHWQLFMEELEKGPLYRHFIQKALETSTFTIRYAWHIGKTSNEVSPHRDVHSKLGTHIFYFNTDEDWQKEWGGELLVLEGKKVPGEGPDFHDFEHEQPIQNMNNHSFLFKNTKEAWHGVKPLQCPEGKYRKLFNVIFMR